MDGYSFEGRVAIVTGAGRGIGRAYALLLADRGARVVVNDLGGSMDGVGADAGVASAVAGEIAAAGGVAIANGDDVADAGGAQALIDAAIGQFGRLDIVVNNAGIIRWAGFPGPTRRTSPVIWRSMWPGRSTPPAPPGPTWSNSAMAAL